jgi:hypothetical protein
MRGAILGGFMVLALAVPTAAQQLTVQANDRKWNGQVWDGAEVYGPIAAPTNTPPDLGVCVVPVSGPETCIERVEGRARKSLCQNSLSCTFTLSTNAREPFGFFVYDIDLRYDDLVDVMVVTPDGRASPEQVQGIERRLRELADTRARVFTPMERDRRARAIQVLTRAQCVEGCTLVQSRIWLKQ